MSEHNQKVLVTLNPFQKLAGVRRCANGDDTIDKVYAYFHSQSLKDDTRAIARAVRKYPKNEWCMSTVSSGLTVDQANDFIRHLNRGYLAQGYKLLQNEKLV